jgi:uncharacterized protein (TIGR02466 family)
MLLIKDNFNIFHLFPRPVGVYNIKCQYSKEEIEFIDNCLNNINKNTGNVFSKDTYVLNNIPTLFEQINEKLNFHFHEVLQYSKKTNIYVTQSWLNMSKKDEYHHVHFHPNSFLSGVFYLKTVIDDSITFHKNEMEQITPDIEKNNDYNSSITNMPIKDNMLIIFPSSTIHGVSKIQSNDTRISLAFNTFLKGELGTAQLDKLLLS